MCLVDMYLLKFDLLVFFGIDIYLKDEFVYFSGSFKYWLVCLLFLYVLCNGCLYVG